MSTTQRSRIINTDVKGNLNGNFQPEIGPRFTTTTEDDIAFMLQTFTRRIGRRRPVLSVKEIMQFTGMSDSAVYGWIWTAQSARLTKPNATRLISLRRSEHAVSHKLDRSLTDKSID